MSLIKKASRAETWLKIGFSGPSGSGKTMSALRFAKGFMGDLSTTVVLDTENGSATLYSEIGDYSVLPFEPPYHPDRFTKAIKYCVDQGFKFIIIDSASAEWSGVGGALDIQSKLGGRFQDWATVTPLHDAFIAAMLNAPAHIMSCIRRKQEYGMVEKGGRMVVEKMGLKEVQRDSYEYELTVNFDINMQHLAVASKDRTNLFNDVTPFLIDENVGKKVANWNSNKQQTKGN